MSLLSLHLTGVQSTYIQVALIQAGTGKIEEELKALSSAYGEKQQAVQMLKRKKGGSLMTAPLEEIITEEHIRVCR